VLAANSFTCAAQQHNTYCQTGSSEDLLLQIQLSRIPSAAKHSTTLNQCRPKHQSTIVCMYHEDLSVGQMWVPWLPPLVPLVLPAVNAVVHAEQHQLLLACSFRRTATTTSVRWQRPSTPFHSFSPSPHTRVVDTCLCSAAPAASNAAPGTPSAAASNICWHVLPLLLTPPCLPPPQDTCSTHLPVQNSTSCFHSSPRNHCAAASV
jgi:hypothetical protein